MQGNIYRLGATYPNKTALPGAGNDQYLMVTAHSYNNFSYCGQDGSLAEYKSQPNPVAALRADIDARVTMVKNWHTQIGGSAVVGFALTEMGIGRKNSSDLNNDLIREHIKYTCNKYRDNGYGVYIWTDGAYGWFRLYNLSTVNGVLSVNWIYSLKEAFLNRWTGIV